MSKDKKRTPVQSGNVSHSLTLEEGLLEYQSVPDEVDEELTELGIIAPERPYSDDSYFDGRLPSNIKSCSVDELVEYMKLMVEYADFLHNKAIAYKSIKKNAEEQLKFVEARVRKTKNGTVQEKKDATICDFRFIEANRNAIKAEELFERVRAVAESASRDVKILSRALEGRRISLDQSRRIESVSRGGRERSF